MRRIMLAAIAVAIATAANGSGVLREKTINGRTFEYEYTASTATNVSVYSISPTAGDIYIPDTIDGTDDVRIGNYPSGGIYIAGKDTTSVRLPRSVKSIPSSTFKDCGAMTNINLESVNNYSPYAFDGCTNLAISIHVRTNTSFSVNKGLSCTFRNCKSLRGIVIDEGVKSLGGQGTFAGCNVETVDFPSTLEKLDLTFTGAALREVVLPDSLVDVGSAFCDCTNLLWASIGSGVKNLNGFRGCTALTNVVFSADSSLTNIATYAFLNCSSLETIVIPEGVVSLGKSAFSDCTSLTNVVLPESLRTIGSSFIGCSSLRTTDIPKGVKSIGSAAFEFSGIVELVLPDGLESVSSELCYGCASLTNVVIPSSVKHINRSAFNSCASLKGVELPENLFEIGSDAFRDSGIKSIVLPDSVTNVAEYAFYGCGLTNIVLGAGVQNIGKYAFSKGSCIIAKCGLPNVGDLSLPARSGTSVKYVVAREFLHEWLPWFETNRYNQVTNYRVIDESAGGEAEVYIADGKTETVGIAAALGLAPVRTATNDTVVLTYDRPEISISAFDAAGGRITAVVLPAANGAIGGELVSGCVSVEWSDDLVDWTATEDLAIDATSYLGEDGKGTFSGTFDASRHPFYRVRAVAR